MSARPVVFISYAHEDRASVEPLQRKLQSIGFEAWLDVKGIQGGELWRQEIERKITTAVALLVAVTPDSLLSQWVKFEVEKASSLNTPILPLILRPVELPAFLSEYQAIDFTGASYEMAMDALTRALVGAIYSTAAPPNAMTDASPGKGLGMLPLGGASGFLCVEGPVECLDNVVDLLERARDRWPKDELLDRGEEIILYRAVSLEFCAAAFRDALGGAYSANEARVKTLLAAYENVIGEYVREAYLNDRTVYGMLCYRDWPLERSFRESLGFVKRVYLDPDAVETSLLTVSGDLRGVSVYVVGLKGPSRSIQWLGGCLMLGPQNGLPERALFTEHPELVASWAEYYLDVERRLGGEGLALDHSDFGAMEVQELSELYVDFYRRTVPTTDSLADTCQSLSATTDMLERARRWARGRDHVVLFRAVVSELTPDLFRSYKGRRQRELVNTVEKYQLLMAEYVREEELEDISIYGTPFDPEQLRATLQSIERFYFPDEIAEDEVVFLRTTDLGFLPTLQNRSLFIVGVRHGAQGEMDARCGCLLFHDRLGMPRDGVYTNQQATLEAFLALWRQLNEELEKDHDGVQLSGMRAYVSNEDEKKGVFRGRIAQRMIDEFNRAHPGDPQEFDPRTMARSKKTL